MRTAACALAALCLLAIASSASALILPGNRTLPDRELIPLACQYVEDGWTVCHPYSQSRYITCGRNARARTCPTGMLYDYGVRRCLPRAYARPCRPHRCPLARSWTPTNVTRFGIQPMLANYTNRSDLSETILLDKVGVTTYFCPSAAHCQHGMITNVVVLANPPRGRPPQHFRVEWIELLRTDDLYPKFIDDIVGYVGDTVEFHWDVPLHNLAAYDPTAPDAAPYIPYIPQPRFHCPFWTFDFSNSSTENLVQVDMLPRGEVRYVNETFQAFGATGPMDFGPGSGFNLTITESMHRKYIVCPHPSHCRMGMVFQLFVQPAPAGYRPRLHTLEWVVIEYWNYPDMTVTAGDIINFYTPAPFIANNDFDFTAIQVYAMSVLDEDLITRLYF